MYQFLGITEIKVYISLQAWAPNYRAEMVLPMIRPAQPNCWAFVCFLRNLISFIKPFNCKMNWIYKALITCDSGLNALCYSILHTVLKQPWARL